MGHVMGCKEQQGRSDPEHLGSELESVGTRLTGVIHYSAKDKGLLNMWCLDTLLAFTAREHLNGACSTCA
jgi:hypothetical protein